jgi:autonomous glycyl radical cofactor GrcA
MTSQVFVQKTWALKDLCKIPNELPELSMRVPGYALIAMQRNAGYAEK